LQDPQVNQFLETRWRAQSLDSIREFVLAVRSPESDSYLFAIVESSSSNHIGNIKIGPINSHHQCADVSYFIGMRECWGRGYATDAIRCAGEIGFGILGLERLQAGVYEKNAGSSRALEKAGYLFEGRLRRQLNSNDGRQDHLWYGLLRNEFSPAESPTRKSDA